MSVLIGITCRNASRTIRWVVESICRLQYPKDRISVLIVDPESSDGTVDIARSVLEHHDVDHDIIVRKCNIPEGRNIILDHAVDRDVDYVLFVDADVVIHDKNVLSHLTWLVDKYGWNIYAFFVPFRDFDTEEELDRFAKHVVDTTCVQDRIYIRYVPWCGMGLTAVPRQVAEDVKFDPDLTFSEDTGFGLVAWLRGYKVATVHGSCDFAYDINLRRRTSIYSRMSIRDYIRGLWKKGITYAYRYYRGGVARSLTYLPKDAGGRKMLYHTLCTTSLVTSVLSSLVGMPQFASIFGILYIVGTGIYIFKMLTESETVTNVLKNVVKQQMFCPLVIVYMLLVWRKLGKIFDKIYDKIHQLNVMLPRS